MRLCLAFICVVPVVALEGCYAGPVPQDAVFLCASTDDCPADLACAVEVGRCVPAEVLASPGPALVGDATIAPSLANDGTEVRVAFVVDQPLAADPVVTLEGASFSFEVARDADAVVEAPAVAYVAIATVGGAAPDGPTTVLADVTAATGRPASLRLGTLTIDRTANRIDGALDASAIIAPGGTVAASFNVLEPVSDEARYPRVVITSSSFVVGVGVEGGEGEGEGEGEPEIITVPLQLDFGDGTVFLYSYTLPTAPVDELELPEGFYGIEVTLFDDAGNESPPIFAGTVLVDATPPTVIESAATITPDPTGAAAQLGFDVDAAAAGAVITVAFSTDEELSLDQIIGEPGEGGEPGGGGGPVVELVCGAATRLPLARDPTEESARFFTYTLVVDDATPEGVCDVVGALIDVAGNSVERTLATVEIDVTAPAPLVDEANAGAGAVLARAPWGATDLDNDGTGDLGTIVVVDADASNEPGARVVALDAAGGVLARGVVGESLDLGALDRRIVDVAAIDGAGNASSITRVTRGLWVATLGGKEPGSLVENPHRGVLHRALPIALDDVASREIGAIASRPDGLAVTARTQAQWTRGPDGLNADLPRDEAASAFDDAKGRAVAFGGTDATVASEDTFEWDGRAWQRLTLFDAPPARKVAAMAYDQRRGAMVVFGGQSDGGAFFDDTWELDGIWRERTPAGAQPPARRGALVAYDPVASEVVLFGGRDASGLLFDTWTYDGTTWTDRTPAGAGPTSQPIARERGAIAFDPARGFVVMYGGLKDTPPFGTPTDDQLWSWDGSTWTVVPMSGAPPFAGNPTVYEHRMVFDAERGAPVVLGMNFGQSFEMAVAVATQAGAWSSFAFNELPSSRAGAVWFVDPARKELVIAGAGGTEALSSLSGAAGAFAKASAIPVSSLQPAFGAVRLRQGASFDPRSNTAIVVAGRTAAGTREQDTFGYDGNRWRRLDTGGGAGMPQSDDMAIAAPSLDALSFGGVVNAVGLVNVVRRFSGTAWSTVTTSGTAPTPRAESAVAVEVGTTNLIVFGGNNGTTALAQTFRLTGTAWSSVGGTQPPARYAHAMAVDAQRGGIIMYGGDDDAGVFQDNPATTPFVDTWLFAGGVWTDITADVVSPGGEGPGPRANHSMATDPVTGRALLFGGTSTDGTRDNVLWELGDAGWQPVDDGVGIPAPRDQSALVADPVRQHVVVFGGTGRDDTFTMDRAPGGRPAVAFYVDLLALGLLGVTLESVDVTALAGGSGPDPDLGVVDGAELLVWQQGAWTPIAAHASSSLASLSASLAPFDAVLKGRTVNVAVATIGTNAADDASVSLDHVEVRVAYRVSP